MGVLPKKIVKKKSPLILAVETSCDETAVTILEGFGKVRSSAIASQVDIHTLYGGVVPEVASRNHLQVAHILVKNILEQAGLKAEEIDCFSATLGPGLASSLLVGSALAKGLAMGVQRPFLGINHMEGHLLSPFFGKEEIPPHVGLIVSGGHTLLVDVQGFGSYRILGRTTDDAAGEAFDKVAKLMGLRYPGGPEIDRLARTGDPQRYPLPRALPQSLNFSFSGLKTAVRYLLEKERETIKLPDLCASFQEAVVDALIQKTLEAARLCEKTLVAVSGGVSGNHRLREKMRERTEAAGVRIVFAPEELSTDNAIMIAYVAAHAFILGNRTEWEADIFPHFSEF